MERGYPKEASTVSVIPSLAPLQVELLSAGSAENVLTAIADSMLATGRGQGELLLVLSQEPAGFIKEAGLSKKQVQDFLFQKARRTAGEWAAIYKAPLPAPGAEDEVAPVCVAPESIVLLAGGGSGGPFAALIPHWARGTRSRSVTREIDTSRM